MPAETGGGSPASGGVPAGSGNEDPPSDDPVGPGAQEPPDTGDGTDPATDPATDPVDASGEGSPSDDGGPITGSGDIRIHGVQSIASATQSVELTLDYTVPADGMLVVRAGWSTAGNVGDTHSVRFGERDMQEVASVHREYWAGIHAAVHTLSVQEGESGTITALFDGFQPRRALIVSTISGVSNIESTFVEGGQPTNENRSERLAEHTVQTDGDALILSLAMLEGLGGSDPVGDGHTLDAFPTVPIDTFHSSRVYGGHAFVGAGSHTLGYQNAEMGWFDHILMLLTLTP